MSIEEGMTFFAGEPAIGKKIEVLNEHDTIAPLAMRKSRLYPI